MMKILPSTARFLVSSNMPLGQKPFTALGASERWTQVRLVGVEYLAAGTAPFIGVTGRTLSMSFQVEFAAETPVAETTFKFAAYVFLARLDSD